jgi:hypothetical protein
VAQSEGPEFKAQYRKKKKETFTFAWLFWEPFVFWEADFHKIKGGKYSVVTQWFKHKWQWHGIESSHALSYGMHVLESKIFGFEISFDFLKMYYFSLTGLGQNHM